MRSFLFRNLLASLSAAVLLSSFHVAAQKRARTKTPVKVPTIAPRPDDVATVEGIMKAFYETISGSAGQPRQWARDRTLYIPGIHFVAVGVQDGKVVARVLDHQSYVEWVNEDFVREGFFESEIHRVTKRFGNIAHVFSSYESRRTLDGPVIGRGVNSIELFYDGKRWWIASVSWDEERPDNPIPKELSP
jgi:hypothetical protein